MAFVRAFSGGEQRTLRKLMQSNERKIETLNVKVTTYVPRWPWPTLPTSPLSATSKPRSTISNPK